MREIWNVMHGLKPAMMMVLVQISFAGVSISYKLAINDGMSGKVMVAYRFIFAAAFVVPVALVFERKSRPQLTWMVVFQGFLCGLLGGSLAQNLYVKSLALTSATYATAMLNLVPAVTFIMAISFGLEKLNFGSLAGKAKAGGTLIGIGGAMLLTFYKGAEVNIWSTHVDILHHHRHPGNHIDDDSINRLLASLLALGSCISYALWLIIQAKMGERYPFPYSSAALMCTMGSIQSTIFAFSTERDWSQWKLEWNIRLLSVSYTGIVASGLMIAVIAWCVRARGPLFVSVFNPLMLVVVAIAGSLVLDEKLHVGSVIGAATIVCGLYVVLWGKSKEIKKSTQLMPAKSSAESDSIDIIVTSSFESNGNNESKGNNENLSIQEKGRGGKRGKDQEDEENGDKP